MSSPFFTDWSNPAWPQPFPLQGWELGFGVVGDADGNTPTFRAGFWVGFLLTLGAGLYFPAAIVTATAAMPAFVAFCALFVCAGFEAVGPFGFPVTAGGDDGPFQGCPSSETPSALRIRNDMILNSASGYLNHSRSWFL
jgi:hypothetical protein